MTIQSKKAQEIDAYIENHNCAKGKQKVEIGGVIKPLESYSLPWKLLIYNHHNRRFNIEILEYENQIGRKLDPADKSDVEIIKKLLLFENVNSDELNAEGKKLYNDLLLIGEQRDVAHITYDGIVVNGNRRMAALELLHKNQPTGKWDELWVVRLPKDISEKDLWKIEAGLQLSKEKVADYGPVNNLLMIYEGKKAGLLSSEIAAAMYGWTEKMVDYDLERLKIIDTFLEFFGQPKNYGLIKKFGLHEHFEDIQNRLTDKLKRNGFPKREVIKKLETVFLWLRASILHKDFRFTHMDARELCKNLNDDQTSFVLTDKFEKYKDKKQIPPEILVDNFDNAKDVRKNKEDAEKPAKLIDRAITALRGIDRKGKHFKLDDDVKTKLKVLSDLVLEMKKELKIK
ncbi:MAG TPA: hypothetical protein PKD67_10210 [Ignavibacteriaceae bacterium]|nr:hypothetical protein [Ignavibacteriaceae bacterium]